MIQKAVRSTTLIMFVTIALIGLLILTGLLLYARVRDVTDRSSISEDFELKTRSVTLYMSDMETSVRGYVLTGQEDFLDPYNTATEDMPRLWSLLSIEATYIDAQSSETETLVILLADMKRQSDTWRTSFAEPTISIRRSGNTSEATSNVRSGTGKSLFDSFRASSINIDRHIQDHVVAYRAEVGNIDNMRLGLLVGLSLLAVGNGVFAMRLMRRDRRMQTEAYSQAESERERLETLIENLPLAVRLVSAPNGNIVMQNRFSELLMSTEEWNKTPMEERAAHFHITLPDGQPIARDQYPSTQTLRKGVTITDFEVLMHAPGTAPRTLLVSSAPLHNQSGRVTGAVVVTKDVTEAKALDQRKDEFIATAAHELRNPLTALSGHYQLLLKQWSGVEPTTTMRRHLDGIGKQVRRTNALIERLLDASRIELGRLVLHKTTFDMVKLGQSAVDDIITADNGQHAVLLDSPESVVMGTWDETRILQAMTNLLSNATRYSPPGTEITLALRPMNGRLRVEVLDQGPGVPENLRPWLFNRYYQAESAAPVDAPISHEPPRPSMRGLGLGLYITAEIIKAHSGEIGVDPNPTGGSIFWFTLPRG